MHAAGLHPCGLQLLQGDTVKEEAAAERWEAAMTDLVASGDCCRTHVLRNTDLDHIHLISHIKGTMLDRHK